MRLDKWLWAARFFKTRSLAARACELGRIQSNGITAKAAREVRPGDRLRIRTDSQQFEVDVLALSGQRGPAALAQTLYQETAESREARARAAAERQAQPDWEAPEGRPSKRQRRDLERLRGRR